MISRFQAQSPKMFYAIALVAFGVQHLRYGDFITGRAPSFPEWLSGQIPFAFVTGLLLIICGIAVLVNKKSSMALVVTGVIILIWSALRNIYGIVVNPEYGALLTNTFKALTIGFGSFIVANSFVSDNETQGYKKFIDRMAFVGKYAVGGFLLICGIQHFIFVDFVKYLVPGWISGAIFWTYLTGIALAAAGFSLITGIKDSLASMLSGCMVFVWLLILHLPRAIANPSQNEWTAVFEALAVSGILLTIAQSVKKKLIMSFQV